ncbi:MAG: NADH-quinone oxidoreductase subunit H [Firmicutes bacterium]|nr:NADH-quinone oxidoreductase subunit H [Bacillota bacterium]
MLTALFHIVIFPGLLFLGVYALFFAFLDRKLYARLQNRVGPPWFQPFADFCKLIGKETIIPEGADRRVFVSLPVFALAAVTAAFIYVPVWSITHPLYSFEGDLIVVLYLLTIPTLCFFLGGWYSTSLYATIGAVRALTQLFSYEVPLFMALLAPAILAGTWSIAGISAYYAAHPLYILINIPAFVVAMVACQGKLERVPFDLPEAETEIVSGTFVEYSGRLLAIFKMAIDCELVVVAALISAIFLPFYAANPCLGFLLFVVKTLIILVLLCLFRASMARVRIEQMVMFCWKILTPLAIIQIIVNLLVRGSLA